MLMLATIKTKRLGDRIVLKTIRSPAAFPQRGDFEPSAPPSAASAYFWTVGGNHMPATRKHDSEGA
jgi:hypothetical protein